MMLIKIGGGKAINLDLICQDLANLAKKQKLVIVHGGHFKRDEIAEKLGCKIQVITSQSGVTSVYTNTEVIAVFLMAYAGLINKQLVSKLQKCGVNAVGLCGVDGRLFEGKRKTALYVKDGSKIKLVKDDLSGKVERVNVRLLEMLLEENIVPVLCPPAISYEGDIINVDGDSVVCLLANWLKPERVVFLIEALGFLGDINNESSLIRRISRSEIENYLELAQGRMKRKIVAIKDALFAGVKEIYVTDGRVERPITKALQGAGTLIC